MQMGFPEEGLLEGIQVTAVLPVLSSFERQFRGDKYLLSTRLTRCRKTLAHLLPTLQHSLLLDMTSQMRPESDISCEAEEIHEHHTQTTKLRDVLRALGRF